LIYAIDKIKAQRKKNYTLKKKEEEEKRKTRKTKENKKTFKVNIKS